MNQFPIHVHIPISNLVDLILDLAKGLERVILLLDALDECEDALKLFETLKTITLDRIQILVSSRDEESLRRTLEAISYEEHPLATQYIRQDLKLYIHEQVIVDSAHRFAKFPDSVKSEIVTRLSSHSQGMFQWARCQLDDLARQCSLNEVRDTLQSLPITLAETYQRILDRMSAANRKWMKRILIWLCGARSPMTLGMLMEATVMNLENFTVVEGDRLFHMDYILEICGSLVSASDRFKKRSSMHSATVSLSRFSVRQYLSSGSAKEFDLPATSIDRMLPCACLNFATSDASASLFWTADAQVLEPNPDSIELLKFHGYCALNLFVHVSTAELELQLCPVFQELLSNERRRQKYYRVLFGTQQIPQDPYSGLEDATSSLAFFLRHDTATSAHEELLGAGKSCSVIATTAVLGKWQLCEGLIKANVDIDMHDDKFWLPVCFMTAAGAVRHLKLVLRVLLLPQTDAENASSVFPNSRDRWLKSLGSALLTAVVCRSSSIVETLISQLATFLNSLECPPRSFTLGLRLLNLVVFLASYGRDETVMAVLDTSVQDFIHFTEGRLSTIDEHVLCGIVESYHSSDLKAILAEFPDQQCKAIPTWRIEPGLLIGDGPDRLKNAHSAWQALCDPKLSLELMHNDDYQLRLQHKVARIDPALLSEDPTIDASTEYSDLQANVMSIALKSEILGTRGELEVAADTVLDDLPPALRQNRLNLMLFYAAKCYNRNSRVMEILLLAGANPNAEIDNEIYTKIELHGDFDAAVQRYALDAKLDALELMAPSSEGKFISSPLWTPLMAACYLQGNHVETAEILLRYGANPCWKANRTTPDARKDGPPGSPLLALASGNGNSQAIIFHRLKKAGALVDINTFVPVDHYGTPLIAAAARGKLKLVKQLLDHGAILDCEGVPDDHWCVPVLSALHEKHLSSKSAQITLRLLEVEDYKSLSQLPLLWGKAFITVCSRIHKNQPDAWDTLAEELLKRGILVNEGVPFKPWKPWTYIADENDPCCYGSAIVAACANGHSALVKVLLDHGANERPQYTGIYGSCLTAACHSGCPEMVRFWLDKGADPKEISLGRLFWNPLIAACHRWNYGDGVQVISVLMQHGYDPNMVYPYQNEPIDPTDTEDISSFVTENSGSWHSASLLRHHWNQTLITGPDWRSALPVYGNPVIAATLCSLRDELLPALLKSGARVNETTVPGFYPSAFFAVYDLKRQRRIHSWLLENGAERPKPEERLNFVRSFGGLIRDDFESCPTISSPDSFWGNMLSLAVVRHELVIPYLLSKGANPHEIVPGSFYGSALIAAAALLRGRALKEFIDSGADANHISSEGYFGAPLIAACAGPAQYPFNDAHHDENNLDDSKDWEEVQFDIIEYLLDNGADPNVAYGGLSPLLLLRYSSSKLREDAIKLLLDRGAKPDLSI